jgi:uncharacterized damage-inducible protein DinB
MAIVDSLLPEFDHEMATTRRLLERVPDASFGWKPHEKSMSLGQLSGHLANIPAWCTAVLELPALDVATAGEDLRPRPPTSRDALVTEFDGKVAAARASLVKRTDPELRAPWTLRNGGHEIFTMPRITAVRSFIMNHLIHHRGQLTVYLRLQNIPLPPIYGPTADEQ